LRRPPTNATPSRLWLSSACPKTRSVCRSSTRLLASPYRSQTLRGQTELITLVGNMLVNSELGRPSAVGEPIKSDAARVQRGDLFYEPGGLTAGSFGGAHRQGWHPEATAGGRHRSADRCHSTNPRAPRWRSSWRCCRLRGSTGFCLLAGDRCPRSLRYSNPLRPRDSLL